MYRLLIPAALAVPVLGLVSPAPQATQRYRIEMTQSQVADLSAFGQPEQVTDIAYEAFVTVTLTDSAAGKVYHVVLDSSKAIKAGGPGVGPEAGGTPGATYHGFVTKEGKTEDFKAMGDTTKTAGLFAQVINDLYPTIRGPLTTGGTWVDTTSTEQDAGGGVTTIQTISTYKVVGPETWQGTSTIRVDAESDISIAMVNPQASLDGTGTGTASYYLTPGGDLVGFSRTSSGDLVFVTAQGDVPVTQSGSLMVTPVK